MENGNPMPLPGFLSDQYECEPLPKHCRDEPSCDCLGCQGDFACEVPDGDCDCDESVGGACEDTPDGPFVQYPHE